MSILLPEGNLLSGSPEKPNSLLRVAYYPRKSNKTEGRSKSVPEQIAFCKQVSKIYGFQEENITIYEEAEGQKGEWYWQDRNGRNPKPWRPELTRLMNDIADGKIDVVQVWRSDRFVRDSGVADAIAKEMNRHGVRLICGHRDMAIDTATGLYQFSVEAANNRRYRDQTSEDIKRDQEFKMMLGLFTRNPSCYGFRNGEKGKQEIKQKEEELKVVNRIFRLFVIGEDDRGPLGINAIANLLMDEGVSLAVGAKGHKAKDPKKVHTSQIRIILSNCMYIGKFRHNGNDYDCAALHFPAADGSGKLETAVPVALYEAAQEKLKLTTRPGKKSAYSQHLLTGLTICAYCGRPLHVHFEKKERKDRPPSRWFVCNHRKPPRYCKPYGMRMIQEDVLDDWVLKELAPLIMAEIESIKNTAGRDADIEILAQLERQIAELYKKETLALKDMVGLWDKDQITRVAADFRAEREQLERKTEEIRARLNRHAGFPDLSPNALAELPKMAVKDALRRAIDWIAIGKDGVVVLTSFGGYIGATFRDVEKGTYFTSETRTNIHAPTPAGKALCYLKWLLSPDDFLKGRRDSMGKRSEKLSDEEILPGISDLRAGDEPVGEVELVIEEITLNS